MYIQDYFCIILIYNVVYCVIGCTRRHYEVNVMSSLILLTCLGETELSNLYISSILKQIYINVREYRRGNQKWTIQRNRQHIEEPVPSQESERSEPLNRNESGRFGALKSDSTHHFFRNACTKSGSLRFSQFSGC